MPLFFLSLIFDFSSFCFYHFSCVSFHFLFGEKKVRYIRASQKQRSVAASTKQPKVFEINAKELGLKNSKKKQFEHE